MWLVSRKPLLFTMNKFIELEIATDKDDVLDNEPDWANLGIAPPEGSFGLPDITFKTIFVNVSNIEHMDMFAVLENGWEICNMRLVSGKMISAKATQELKDLIVNGLRK
jgi:hypothetical protein